MPITFNETEAVFTGECKVADADSLYEWLQKYPEGKVRMGQCTHFHAALLQVLMAVKATIVEPPENLLLRRWIFGLGDEAPSLWMDQPAAVLQVERMEEPAPTPAPTPTPTPAPVRPATRNTRTRRRPATSTAGTPYRKEEEP